MLYVYMFPWLFLSILSGVSFTYGISQGSILDLNTLFTVTAPFEAYCSSGNEKKAKRSQQNYTFFQACLKEKQKDKAWRKNCWEAI